MVQPVNYDQPRSALERLLGDETNRTLLISNKTKEEERLALVQGFVSEIGDDAPSQEDTLKAIVETLAKEGSSEDVDQRDAALAILTSAALADMLTTHSHTVYHAYLDAIRNLTKANDPYAGSIPTLLEAGEAIAPFFSKGKQSLSPIMKAWRSVAEQFTTDLDARLHILLESDKITGKVESEADAHQGKVAKPGKRETTQQFDDQVEPLIKQGLINKKIVEQLEKLGIKTTLAAVKVSARRLRKEEKIQRRKKGKTEKD